MSRFGARLVRANQVIDEEFGDTFLVRPMTDAINETPEPDPTRTGGTGFGILKAPGTYIGRDPSLRGMHNRASAEIKVFFMARGAMADLRRPDQLTVTTSHINPELIGRTFEVADGPAPRGFGRFEAGLISVPGPGEAPIVRRDIRLVSSDVPPWEA